MSMFNSYWKCNYDELITFYPRFYREVFEMEAILRAEGSLADGIQCGIEKMLMNNFIDEMDEDTLTKLETFLDLSMMKKRTVEERRRFIKSFFAGLGKVSETRIAEMIRAYTGADTKCDFYPFDEKGNNRLDIQFERGNAPVIYISDIYTLLAKMLPAHIEYRAMLTYRFSVGVRARRTHYKYLYDLCGTKPYSILIAQIEGAASVVEPDVKGAVVDYKISSKNGGNAGQYPNIALLAQIEDIAAVTQADIDKALMDYKTSSENGDTTGKYPDVTLLAQIEGVEAATQADIKGVIIDELLTGTLPNAAQLANIEGIATITQSDINAVLMNEPQAGVNPQTATLGHNDAINTAAEVVTSDCSVNYIPCGTTFTG